MANQVNWFEIAATDLDRAAKFYANVFKVELTPNDMPHMKMRMFPMEQGGEYSTGALVQGQGIEPSQTGTLVYFTCQDLANEAKLVEENGGKVVLPKTSIGEHGYIAHFIDTEGNKVALHSMN